MSVRAPVGPVNFSTDDICIGRGLAAIRTNSELDREFLFYQLLEMQEEIGGTEGAVFASINKSQIEGLEISFPPLPEQKRIVAILDEAFEAIATAKANTEKNLQNARALFESHLNAVFSQKGEGWVEKRLGDIVEEISTGPFGSLLHKSDYIQDGIPLVNPINIKGSQIVPDSSKTVGFATARRLAKYALQANDLVIARRGELGRCAVIGQDHEGWLCGTGCFFIRPPKEISPDFLGHLLRSSKYREKMEAMSGRATMPSISNRDLSNLVVVIPSLKVQQIILEEIDSASTETQRLESLYQRKLTALDELKKSLLHQAFSGGL
jgi:type I restriction enzyme S subunit